MEMLHIVHTNEAGLSGAMVGTVWARVPGRCWDDRRAALVVRVRVWMEMVWRRCNWDLRILPSSG